MDQSFSEKSFWKTLRKGDAQKYSLGKTRAEIRKSLKFIEEEANKEDFSFKPFNEQIRNKSKVFTTNSSIDEFILRKVSDNLKRSLSIRPADRNDIIPQIITLAREARDCSIHKFDISSFFENIDRSTLMANLMREEKLSPRTTRLISTLFHCDQFSKIAGLPRGLSISPILAEYYLKGLDSACRRLDYCYFYTRYVDDMLFFCHGDTSSLAQDITKNLPPGLNINPEKTSSVHIDSKGLTPTTKPNSISYLGYEILFPTSPPADIRISIPTKKIDKIKSRIAMSVVRFTEDKKYEDLLLRIRFLTCNFKIGGSKQIGILYSGVHYNHRYIDQKSAEKVFSELDSYLQKLIYSKSGSIGKKLSILLNNKQRKELCSHSFKLGYNKPVYRNLKNKELGEAKEVWAHA